MIRETLIFTREDQDFLEGMQLKLVLLRLQIQLQGILAKTRSLPR